VCEVDYDVKLPGGVRLERLQDVIHEDVLPDVGVDVAAGNVVKDWVAHLRPAELRVGEGER